MADTITCPVCGEANPADMEFCRNCQSRLQHLTGSLRGENSPIQPGQLPTKKVTAELEPLLPQWLREARQQARDTAADDASKAAQDEKPAPAPSGSDLLAGLQSKSAEDDEEVPDWLEHITGATGKKKKPVPEENQVRWVELGPKEEPQPPASQPHQPKVPEKDELTDWFKQAAATSGTADFRMPAKPEPVVDEEPKLEKGSEPQTPAEDMSRMQDVASQASTPPAIPSADVRADREEAPDWLKKLQADQASAEPLKPTQPPVGASAADTPDWLKNLGAEPGAGEPPAPARAPSSNVAENVPDWLKSFGEAESNPPANQQAKASESKLPDWLKGLQPTDSEVAQPDSQAKDLGASPVEAKAEPSAATDAVLPDWLKGLQPPAAEQTPAEQEPLAPEPAVPTELPDWVASLGSKQTEPAEDRSKDIAAPSESTIPDWASSISAGTEPTRQPPVHQEPAAAQQPAVQAPLEQPVAAGDAFTSDAVSGDDVDAIFASLQTPDWLSAVLPVVPPAEEKAPPAAQETEEEPIIPAELPSWVQAMRPVEAALGSTAPGAQDTAPEERGPLAGLHGVLPVIPGAAMPSSKPKAHSIKLDATQQQIGHAALLEKILAAETAPIPMKSTAQLRSQRILRWAIGLVLVVLLAGVLFSGSENWPLPNAAPIETVGALNAIEALPSGAPVLMVFDYQPSTVGEMQAAGAGLVEHLAVLKRPHFALISTSPTGSALAERFMSTAMPDIRQPYLRDSDFVDLGYLPGGLAGVYNFSQNPTGAVPLDANSRPVWQSATLAPVRKFSDFAAVIVLTDSIESGRTWVEQTSLARGQSTMVIVASAQAAPMLLPYVDSGQVSGMVSSLYGAAGVEERNVGLPGFVRRYWDAYGAGLYLAALLIVLGGLWNLWLGMRDRSAQAVV